MNITNITDNFKENTVMLDIADCPLRQARLIKSILKGWTRPKTLVFNLNKRHASLYLEKLPHFDMDGFIEALHVAEESINEVMGEVRHA